MAEIRTANATWSGDLLSGSGSVSAGTTGRFTDLAVTWAARTEAHGGLTSPEELLAAAHASCFSMALSSQLAKRGHRAERLDVEVAVSAEKLDAGWTVTASAITVRGRVPGAAEADFREAAEAAKDGCPISRALKGNVALSVEATLEG
jgi:osmotically inducible protein OsmC